MFISVLTSIQLLPQDEELRDSRSDSEEETVSESDHDDDLDLNKKALPDKEESKPVTNCLKDDQLYIQNIDISKTTLAQDLN